MGRSILLCCGRPSSRGQDAPLEQNLVLFRSHADTILLACVHAPSDILPTRRLFSVDRRNASSPAFKGPRRKGVRVAQSLSPNQRMGSQLLVNAVTGKVRSSTWMLGVLTVSHPDSLCPI